MCVYKLECVSVHVCMVREVSMNVFTNLYVCVRVWLKRSAVSGVDPSNFFSCLLLHIDSCSFLTFFLLTSAYPPFFYLLVFFFYTSFFSSFLPSSLFFYFSWVGAYDKESVEYIVNSMEGKKYYHFFKHMLLGSEEHYYVSLLYNWPRTKAFIQTLSAESVWNTWKFGTYASMCTFSENIVYNFLSYP